VIEGDGVVGFAQQSDARRVGVGWGVDEFEGHWPQASADELVGVHERWLPSERQPPRV
jgi:hypothetical protein